MKILVTGGAGYLGSVSSAILLAAGHSVRVLDNLRYGGQSLLASAIYPGFEFVRGDICDCDVVSAALQGMDAVVHLAAIVGDPACAEQPDYARAVNLNASLTLLELCRLAAVRRLVFASTCSNYGKMRDTSELATEQHELRPVSLYSETKVAVEREYLAAPPDEIGVTVLRFATLYGLSPRMRFDLTVNEFVMRMLTDRELTVYGEQFWRPYVHVRDAAKAIEASLAAPAAASGKVFNVGDTKENYRKRDIIEAAKQRVGEVDVKTVHKNEDPRDYRVSFEAIKAHLAFTVTRRLADGIDEIATAIESGMLDHLKDARKYNSGSAVQSLASPGYAGVAHR